MREGDSTSGWKKVFGRLTPFEWLSAGKAARGREAILHGASFLLVLLLMAAGHGQLVAHPFWSAFILFVFGLGYAIASSVFDEPNYMYPKLALWTFAFFMFCYGKGLSPVVYPPVATIVIWMLWVSAGNRDRDERFNTAIYRGVFLSTIVFGWWAIYYNYGHREVPTITFLIYGLSMAYFHYRRPRPLYGYFAGIYLSIGAIYTATNSGMLMEGQTGSAVQLMALLVFMLAVLEHSHGRFQSAKPYYVMGTVLTGVCFLMSLWTSRFLLDQFALMAFTIGLPYIMLRFQRLVEKKGELPSGEAGWELALLCCYNISIHVALLLIVIAPVFMLGHVLWSALLLSAFSLLALMLESHPGSRVVPRGHMHRTALFIGISAAWMFGLYRGGIVPHVLGLAVVSAMWACIWLALKNDSKYRSLSDAAADSQAALTSLLVLTVVLTQHWGRGACIAAAVCLVSSLVVAAGSGRLTGWVSASASAAVFVVAATGMGFEPFKQWVVLEAIAVVSMLMAYVNDRNERLSSMLSGAGVVSAVAGISLALGMPGGSKAIICLSASLGVPIAVSALLSHQKKKAASWLLAVVNVVGVFLLIFAGLTVTLPWVGVAVLMLVVFFSISWIKSRIWTYAFGGAATFAIGALMVAAGLVGLNWMFMAAAAIVCTMLLRVREGTNDAASRKAVAFVGHAVAVYAMLVMCGGGEAATQWQTALSLVIFGAVYWFEAGFISTGHAVARFFFSLSLLSLSILVFGSDSYKFLAVPAVLVPVWAVVGALKGDEEGGAGYCRTSALLGAFLCVIASALGANIVFVLCLAGFLVCLSARSERIYMQLVLMAMALMGYGWVRHFGSHFTLELFFFMMLVIGLAMLIELSPYIWKFIDDALPFPFLRLFSRRGVWFGAIVGALIGLVCIMGVGIAATEHPSFCKTCHIMDRYFDAWEHSSHKDVACIKCHYEPGFAAHVKGKIGAISEVAAYLTGRFEHKQHGEVSNATCQRPGCHVDMVNNTSVSYDGRIDFNHKLHSKAISPDHDMPCITCHTEEVKGDHLRIASSVCFLCHFMGHGKAAQRTSDCKTCHDAPSQPVKMGDATFDHKEFFNGRTDVDCHFCHKTNIKGDAHASSIRCQSCHYGDKLATVDKTNIKELHRKHIFENHAICFDCHGILRHGETSMASMSDAQNCGSCHAEKEQHTLQAKVFMGKAVEGVDGDPNIMYEAGISCMHCHLKKRVLDRGGKKFATSVSTAKYCVVCHGDEDYEEMYKDWQTETRDSLASLEALLKEAKAAVGTAAPEAARSHLARAEEMYNVVISDGSLGVHNVEYIDEIISQAKKEAKKAKEAAGTPNN